MCIYCLLLHFLLYNTHTHTHRHSTHTHIHTHRHSSHTHTLTHTHHVHTFSPLPITTLPLITHHNHKRTTNNKLASSWPHCFGTNTPSIMYTAATTPVITPTTQCTQTGVLRLPPTSLYTLRVPYCKNH